jgi:hypothetical protein
MFSGGEATDGVASNLLLEREWFTTFGEQSIRFTFGINLSTRIFQQNKPYKVELGSISACKGISSFISYCEVIDDDPLPWNQHCYCSSRWVVSRQFAALSGAG